ncbi:MAG: ABC transporter permease/substrate binding protein [Tetragenococcus sp.]|nr:ABC transporter permease/substrate binding protein [Tetragenococcus sp.]
MLDFLQQTIPLSEWVDSGVDWLTEHWAAFFSFLQTVGETIMDGMTTGLSAIPPLLFIVILTVLAFFLGGKKWQLPTFTLLGLLLVYNQDLWGDLLNTVTLVIVASVISVVIGVPVGILMSKNETAKNIITPVLDFMQTMPNFVYLIPAVAFFGIGMVPGAFASVIFSLPPTVRMTNLGIRQVPTELTEASDSFGGTSWQKLFKLELPLAKGNIFAGINQTMMLALSMVVVASMIGAPGLGQGVLSAVQRSQVGSGFVYGIAVVILAIILDRFTQKLNSSSAKTSKDASTKKSKRNKIIAGVVIAAVVIAGIAVYATSGGSDDDAAANKGNINLSYVEWDTEVASTNVMALVLEDMGYTVSMTPLDNAVNWEAVSNGESDATLSAWLPVTQKPQYDQFKDQVDELGPNLEGANLGIAVPDYVDADSIEDLDDQIPDKEIVGIEPGAGVVNAAEETVDTYDNLSDWEVTPTSSGAMTSQLGSAMQNEEPIAITAWSPHWMFQRYDLNYLDDPEGTMGEAEHIDTLAREGLEDDMPEAYSVLDNFYWETDDIETVMLAIEEGQDPEEAAQDWIDDNPDKVEEWTEDAE